MYPTLLDLGIYQIRSFGLCMVFAIFSSFFLLKWLRKKDNFEMEFWLMFVSVLMVFGMLGARVAYVCEYWTEVFKDDLYSIIDIKNGGFVFYGGFIGASLAGTIFCLIMKRSLTDTLDVAATVLPLGHAWGRVGCFLNGCCFGRISDSSISVCYPRFSNAWCSQVKQELISGDASCSLAVLPSQLIEAALNLAICVILVILYRWKKRIPGMQMALYAIMYSSVRFYTETLRSDRRAHVFDFSIAQFISIFLMAFGIGMLIFCLIRNKRKAKNAKIIA